MQGHLSGSELIPSLDTKYGQASASTRGEYKQHTCSPLHWGLVQGVLLHQPCPPTSLHRYDYACNDQELDSLKGKVCGMLGTPQELAAICDADPSCLGMSFFPHGRDYLGALARLLLGAAERRLGATE